MVHRDYQSELEPLPTEVKTYNGSMSVGKRKPYNHLLEILEQTVGELLDSKRYTDKFDPTKKTLQELAWRLGDKGETHVCEVIMNKAFSSSPLYLGSIQDDIPF